MSYKLPHIRRPARLLEWPVLKSVDFELGDMLWFDAADSLGNGHYVYPLHDFTWDTDEATTRRNCMPYFVGVAVERRTGKEDHDTVMVVPSGCVFEMPCESATPVIGTLLGFSQDGSNQYLDSDQLEVVTDIADAVGYCVKRYTAATTTVECVLFSPYDVEGGLASRQHFLTFGACDLNAAADIVTNFTFKKRVKLLSITTVERSAATGNSVLTVKNGANSLDDTHTVTATGVGTVLRTAISDANGYDIFAHDDQMDIACDGTASAGTADVIIEYMDLPGLET